MPILIGISAVLAFGFLAYVLSISPDGLDAHNYESARKNAATLVGCLVGLLVVYPLDRYKINFTTDGVWYSRVIKLVLGLGIVLAVKSGLSKPLEALFSLFIKNEYVIVARAVRYFLIVITAGVLWPLTFGFFAKLRIPFMDKFTLWLKSKIVKT